MTLTNPSLAKIEADLAAHRAEMKKGPKLKPRTK